MFGFGAMGRVATAMLDSLSFHRSLSARPTLGLALTTTHRQPPYTSPTVRRADRRTARPGRAMATDDSRSPFGERLRRLRVAAGLSQEALAERSGLSAQAIGALETGKRRRPYPHTVAALADALELTEGERSALAEARVTRSAVAISQPPLPRQRAPLVGREQEVREIVALLHAGRDRLLTLTGPGGVGKTSLALAVADAAGDAFGGDVAFVPLATIADAGLVASEVAAALGL